MRHLHIIVLAVILLNQNSFGYQVKDAPLLKTRPSWLKVCRRSDPELNTCLNDLFIGIFPELAKGIPELNVDRFEPLPLDRVSVSKGSGAIILQGSLYNLIVAGPSNATPSYTEFDIANKKWNFGLDLPLLNIKSQYSLKGKILVLPLYGQGDCELQLGKVNTKVTTDMSFPIIDGREIVKIDKMHVSFTVGHMKVNLQNLFNGNELLGRTVNTFINANALEVINELEESIGESLARIFTDIMNNIYTKMPTDLWLLSDEEYAKYEHEQKLNGVKASSQS